jgi:hypothetical protein
VAADDLRPVHEKMPQPGHPDRPRRSDFGPHGNHSVLDFGSVNRHLEHFAQKVGLRVDQQSLEAAVQKVPERIGQSINRLRGQDRATRVW